MQKTTAYLLEEGRKTGFSAVEAFAEKTERREYVAIPGEAPLVHTRDSRRASTRAFWDSGSPVGFSLSRPDAAAIKAAYANIYAAHFPDQGLNFGKLLPAAVQKVDLAVYDQQAGEVDVNSFNQMQELLDEIMSELPFQGLELLKIQLIKEIGKIYIANTNGLDAKYIKSRFSLNLSVALHGNRMDVNQTRVFFQQLDPLRLISRALNLLESLPRDESLLQVPPQAYLIFSPESAAFILREFSHYFKTKADPALQRIQFPAQLNITDNPLLNGQAGSVPFDDEGVQGGETFLIRKGVFENVIRDLAGAVENGGSSTGNGFRNHRTPFPAVRFSNLYIKPTVLPLKNLRSDAGEGIVVSLVKLKATTNQGYLFSAYGYRFKEHQIMEPVHFYLRTTFRSFLTGILKISKEIKYFHGNYTIGSPYLLARGDRQPDGVLLV